jgi:hypothetical protein
MQEARGSSPLISTKDFGHLGGLFFWSQDFLRVGIARICFGSVSGINANKRGFDSRRLHHLLFN